MNWQPIPPLPDSTEFSELFEQLFGVSVEPASPDDPRLGQEPPRLTDEEAAARSDNARRSQLQPRSQKRGRGKAADTLALGDAAYQVLRRTAWAMTLRQLFYALVSESAIPKTEAAYAKLKRVMRDLREDGSVPWDWLVDHTRAVFRPRTFDGLEGLLNESADLYRRDLMRQQKVAIQLWAESDSIGSVIAQVADRYTIPTFIGRGYAARGYLWEAAKDAVAAHAAGKEVVILHVGDYDPSGEDIFRDVEETLRLYSVAVEWEDSVNEVRRWLREEIHDVGFTPDRVWRHNGETEWQSTLVDKTTWLAVERLALTPEQIAEHELPERPPKKSDPRTKTFRGSGVVEVEALPVDDLLSIVGSAITDFIDTDALRVIEVAEQSEREVMQRIAATSIEKLVEAAS
jgi:hypothetical protein